ncbi:MAG: type II secretion system F family protein [Clostridium butyricum]|nr:type II secretion system F family protein [Clostridium butyricum]
MNNKKVSLKHLMIISRNLGQIYKDGIPINEGIEIIGDTIHNKEYKQSLKKISIYMKDGLNLSDSFKKFDYLYPQFFTGLISIGENTGKLYEVLCGLSLFYEKYLNITESLKSACVYPAFVLISIAILILLLTEHINPSFYDIYKSINISPPASCIFLYKVKLFFEQNMYTTIFSILCWGAVFAVIFKCLNKRFNVESFRRLKIVKNIIEYITVLLFSILFSTGINISKGLSFCEDSIRPKYLNEKLKEVNNQLIKGRGLAESLEKSGLLSKYTLTVVKIREESGTISEGFKEISEDMEQMISKEIKKYLSYITPAFVVIMGICVMIFLGVFVLPLYDSLQLRSIR